MPRNRTLQVPYGSMVRAAFEGMSCTVIDRGSNPGQVKLWSVKSFSVSCILTLNVCEAMRQYLQYDSNCGAPLSERQQYNEYNLAESS